MDRGGDADSEDTTNRRQSTIQADEMKLEILQILLQWEILS